MPAGTSQGELGPRKEPTSPKHVLGFPEPPRRGASQHGARAHGPVSGAHGPLPWDQSRQVLWAGHGQLLGLPASDVPREAQLTSLLISGASRPSADGLRARLQERMCSVQRPGRRGHRPAPPRGGCRHAIPQTRPAPRRPHPFLGPTFRELHCGSDVVRRTRLTGHHFETETGSGVTAQQASARGSVSAANTPGGSLLCPQPQQGDTQLCVLRCYVAPGTK